MKKITSTGLLVCFCFYGANIFGQPVLSGGAGVEQKKRRPGQVEFPKAEIESPVQVPGLVLPPAKPHQRPGVASSQLRVFVKRFAFDGNTVFSDADLSRVTAPYEGRIITSAELQQVRENIGLRYLSQGYINSGVIIPDQKVEDGVINLQVIEGGLTRIEIAGNNRLSTKFISKRLRYGAGEPLNIRELEQALKVIQQNPVIKRVNAELRPGDRLGESVLLVQVEEDRPARADLSFNNNRPPSVGAEQLEFTGTYYSLTGNGDPLTAYFGGSKGLYDVFLSYQFPVNVFDTRLGAYFEYTDSEVIESPFDDLDIESDATTWGISVTHPLQRTPAGHLLAGIALEKRRSNSSLLGVPFSFSEGFDEGRADITPLRLSLDWLQREPDSVLAARSVITVGLDAFGATVNSGGVADGRFVAWLGQLQWVKRFGSRGYRAILKASSQLTRDSLLPMEKFVVGGVGTVRGYRENQLVRDNGYVVSAQLGIPVFIGNKAEAQWRLAPFVDYGRAWEEAGGTPSPRDIASAGIELSWQPIRRFNATLSAAHAFEDIDRVDQDRDLQDMGINFTLDYRLY